jgi:hypothetical protein
MIVFVVAVFISLAVIVIIGCIAGIKTRRVCKKCGKHTRELFGGDVNNNFYCTGCYSEMAIKNNEKSALSAEEKRRYAMMGAFLGTLS